jgi:hypothetical protein
VQGRRVRIPVLEEFPVRDQARIADFGPVFVSK